MHWEIFPDEFSSYSSPFLLHAKGESWPFLQLLTLIIGRSFSFCGHSFFNADSFRFFMYWTMESLIPVISKLQDVFATVGHRESEVQLPQIVVVSFFYQLNYSKMFVKNKNLVVLGRFPERRQIFCDRRNCWSWLPAKRLIFEHFKKFDEFF